MTVPNLQESVTLVRSRNLRRDEEGMKTKGSIERDRAEKKKGGLG